MSRYIDADEALRMMRNSKQDCPLIDDKRGIWDVAHDCTISCVEAVPTADVVEVRHGEWVESGTTRFGHLKYKCNCCGYQIGVVRKSPNFCSQCGAKMDGERKTIE